MRRLVEGSFLGVVGEEFERVAGAVGVVQRDLRFGDRRVRVRFAGAGCRQASGCPGGSGPHPCAPPGSGRWAATAATSCTPAPSAITAAACSWPAPADPAKPQSPSPPWSRGWSLPQTITRYFRPPP